MKKFLWLLIFLPLIYFIRGGSKSAPEEIHVAAPKNKPVPRQNSRRVFLSKRKVQSQGAAVDPCEKVAQKLSEIDFNAEVPEWIEAVKVESFDSCRLPELQERIAQIRANCFAEKVNQNECLANLLMYRSFMRSKKITEPTTREELADLIMGEFSKSEPDFKRLKVLASELLRQNPNDRPVQKVWAMAAVISEGDPRRIRPELVEEVYRTLDPEAINTDPELRSLDIILKTGLRPDSVESYVRDILRSNGNDLNAREMLGWALWQQGRRKEAIAQVDSILAQKDDPYLRNLRRALLDPKANEKSYSGRLSLGVQLEDLWN